MPQAVGSAVPTTLDIIGLRPATLTAGQTAAYFGLSTRTFRKEVAAGNLPQPIRLRSRCYRWSISALDSWIAGNADQAGTAIVGDPIIEAIRDAKAKRTA